MKEEKRVKENFEGTEREFEEMWETYPQTPEHFRETVRRAVQQQMGQTVSDTPKIRRSRKWRRLRFLLPAAAAFACAGIAVAAGGSVLFEYLSRSGVLSESEEETLIQNDLPQEAENLPGAVYGDRETADKDWKEPLLTVTEAYFDGSEFYFTAELSKEGQVYDLSIRDHVSVNGQDAGVNQGFAPTEDPNIYIGRIQVTDAAALAQNPESGTVELGLTINASPKREEAAQYYTWKDEDAYRRLYQTGAFTYSLPVSEDEIKTDGEAAKKVEVPYYVLTWEDALLTYTPQKLTVEVALPGGGIPSEKQEVTVVRQQEEPADTGELAGQEPARGTKVTEQNLNKEKMETGETAQDDPISISEEGTEKFRPVTIENNHISGALSGAGGVLQIDADVVQEAETAYIELLDMKKMPIERLTALYPEGESQDWHPLSEGEADTWQYQDRMIYASSEYGHASYTNVEADTAKAGAGVRQEGFTDSGEDGGSEEDTAELEAVQEQTEHVETESTRSETNELDPGKTGQENETVTGEKTSKNPASKDVLSGREAENRCAEILTSLGIDGRAEKLTGNGEYRIISYRDGLPIADGSQIYGNGRLYLENGTLSELQWSGPFEVREQEETDLLDMEKVMEHLEGYLADGTLQLPLGGQPVTRVTLEYYLDMTSEGITCRPVWNFQVPYLLDIEEVLGEGLEMYCYIDAATGALVRDTWGW